jgi:hypothetical protein
VPMSRRSRSPETMSEARAARGGEHMIVIGIARDARGLGGFGELSHPRGRRRGIDYYHTMLKTSAEALRYRPTIRASGHVCRRAPDGRKTTDFPRNSLCAHPLASVDVSCVGDRTRVGRGCPV